MSSASSAVTYISVSLIPSHADSIGDPMRNRLTQVLQESLYTDTMDFPCIRVLGTVWDEAPIEDQPLPADASPTSLSPSYMSYSNIEEDPEEDNADYLADGGDGDDELSDIDDDDDDDDEDEDPKEDHADYLADGGDGDDELSNIDDDDDDEDEEAFEDEDDDEEEEDHLASSDSSAVPVIVHVPLAGDTKAFETNKRELALLLLLSDSRSKEILTAGAARLSGLDIVVTDAIAGRLMPRESVTKLATTIRQDTDEFHVRFEDEQDDRAFLRAQVNTLFKDRQYHHRTAMLLDREATYACRAWTGSEDRSVAIEAHKMAPKRRTTTTPTTSTPMTDAQIKALIERGVTAALTKRDADKSRNDDDSHDSGTGGRRQVSTVRECTYTDFLKCQPLNFKGTEGVFGSPNVRNDVSYAMPWKTLKRTMTDKYCPRGEIKKLETKMWNLKVKGTDVLSYNQHFQELALMYDRMFLEESDEVEKYVGGLPDMIHGSVKASKPKVMQEATELMDQKILTFTARQAEKMRNFDDTSGNNQNQQQPFKRNNVARTYTAGPKEKKPYGGSKPLCPK
nr:hypothetical protein [Tanacetum cinerariifolium]